MGKISFLAGLGVGYVLGTRAGRERFEQIVGKARQVWESPTVQEAAGVVQAQATKAAETVQDQATKLYDQSKKAVSEKLHREDAKELDSTHNSKPTANAY